MTSWIRERGWMTTAADASRTIASASSNLKSNKKMRSGKESKQKGLKQTSLKDLLVEKQSNVSSRKPSSWISALYTNGKAATDLGNEEEDDTDFHAEEMGAQSHKKRKRVLETDELTVSTKKLANKRRRDSPSSTGEDEEQRKPAASFNLMSIFGPPPPSSLSLTPRTPKSISARRKAGLPAPAITPSKRKSLIDDSAKDIAVQQHRQWEKRSSSPLQVIDNVAANRKSPPEKDPKHSRATTGLTPSKLRHGYSMIAFEEDEFSGLQSRGHEDCEGIAEEGEEDCEDREDSPSAEKQERSNPTSALTFVRSPRSNRRIYAQETQMCLDSPLQGYNTATRDKEDAFSTIFESPYLSPGVCAEEGLALLDSDETLSSPPPSPTSKTARRELDDVELPSSQTAPGGSFLLQDDEEPVKERGGEAALLDSYMSEETFEEDVQYCADETYKLPSSQDYTTPTRPGEIRTKLRSSSKVAAKQKCEVVEEEELPREAEETQPLPWSPCDNKQGRATSITKSQRVSASWADVNNVWMPIAVNQYNPDETVVIDKYQSSLHNFGFEVEQVQSSKKKKEKVAIKVNNDIEFDSDEGVESDDEQQGEEEEQEATQILPWGDEEEEEEEEGDDDIAPLSLLPSEGDLESQTRRFLDLL